MLRRTSGQCERSRLTSMKQTTTERSDSKRVMVRSGLSARSALSARSPLVLPSTSSGGMKAV